MSKDLGISSESSTYKAVLLNEEKHRFSRGLTIKSGEGALLKGQVIAREKSTGKYRALKTAVAKTTEAQTEVPTALYNKNFCAGSMASTPVLPGSVTMHATVAASPCTLSDNRDGLLLELANKAMGKIDYTTGQWGLNTAASMVTADAVTIDYTTFNNGNLELDKLAILTEDAEDATLADVDVQALESGIVNYAELTPTVDITDENYLSLFRKSGFGFKLEKEY